MGHFMLNPFIGALRNFYGDIALLGLDGGLKICLDAGALASYPGSGQKFLDLTGGGFDFFRGADNTATTDDPTFNGVAGNLSASEYFSSDGGDFFTYDTNAETFMQDWAKDNALCTLLWWVYPATAPANGAAISTYSSGGVNGLALRMDNQKQNITVFNASAHRLLSGNAVALNTWDTAAWHLIGASINEPAGASGAFLFRDGGYDPVSAGNTFDATYANADPAANTSPMVIGAARSGGNTPLASGTRVAAVAAWSAALTRAQLADIWLRTRARFGYSASQAWHTGRKGSGITFSNSDLTLTMAGGSGEQGAMCLDFGSSGKLYFEFLASTLGGACMGVCSPASPMSGTNVFGNAGNWIIRPDNGNKCNGTTTGAAYGSALTSGDVIMVAVDLATHSIWWGKNGTWFNSGNPAAGTNPAFTNLPEIVTPYVVSFSGGAHAITARFKSSQWTQTPPSGFSAWPTA